MPKTEFRADEHVSAEHHQHCTNYFRCLHDGKRSFRVFVMFVVFLTPVTHSFGIIMYHPTDKSIKMKCSTSPLASNLSVCVDAAQSYIYYAVGHRHDTNLIISSVDGANVVHKQITNKEPSMHYSRCIVQMRLLSIAKKMVLVLTSRTGIQLFDAETTKALFYHPVADPKVAEKMDTFGRGICSVEDSMILVGTHTGQIFVFFIPDRGTKLQKTQLLTTISDVHKDAIWAIESDGNRVVSSDETGAIALWEVTGAKINMVRVLAGTGSPCTCVALWRNLIIGAFACGHLRVFNADAGYMAAEVTAHSRWITALHVAKNTGRLLSASEDTFVRVWQLSTESPEIKHIDSLYVPDVQLQGACFIDDDGHALGCTGYDTSDIVFFSCAT